MLNGSSSQVFIVPAAPRYLLAGGSGGGDDPRYPWTFKSLHEVDAVVPAIARGGKRPAAAVPGGAQVEPYGCPICFRMFATAKAVHGHMRSHTDRSWRGMEPPRPEPLSEPDGRLYPYVCDRCKMPFQTRQALGGHRASHKGKKGCSWLEREELAAAEEARKPIVFDVDLNLPAPEAEEQEEEE